MQTTAEFASSLAFAECLQFALRCLIDILPRLLIVRKFSTLDIFIPHHPFISFRKMFQPGHL